MNKLTDSFQSILYQVTKTADKGEQGVEYRGSAPLSHQWWCVLRMCVSVSRLACSALRTGAASEGSTTAVTPAAASCSK